MASFTSELQMKSLLAQPKQRTFTRLVLAALLAVTLAGKPKQHPGSARDDCNFIEFDATGVTNEQFAAEYHAGKFRQPTLLQNAFEWREEFESKESFKDTFGNMTFFVSTKIEAQSFYQAIPGKKRTTVGAWVDQLDDTGPEAVPYIFYYCQIGPDCLRRVVSTYGIPQAVQYFSGEPFISGGKESLGIALHRHGPTWAACLAGIKEWYVFANNKRLPVEPVKHRPKAELLEQPDVWHCRQRPGEVIFLPSGWWHATAHAGPWTLAIGAQEDASAANFDAVVGDVDALRRRPKEELLQANKNGVWPMHHAAMHGHVDAVELLLKAGTSVHQESKRPQDETGKWPIHYAASNGHLAVARLLLKHQSAVRAPQKWPQPLYLASEAGHAEMADLLLRVGADVEQVDGFEGLRPLQGAANLGQWATVKVLLAHRVDVSVPVRGKLFQAWMQGYQPIHLAARGGYIPALKLLLQNNAAVGAKVDSTGVQPLHIAAEFGHSTAARLLVANRAAADAVAANGMRPLDYAAKLVAQSDAHRDLVKFLQGKTRVHGAGAGQPAGGAGQTTTRQIPRTTEPPRTDTSELRTTTPLPDGAPAREPKQKPSPTLLFAIADDGNVWASKRAYNFWEITYSKGRDGEWSVPYASTDLRRFYKERPRGFAPRGVALELGCGRGMDVLWMAKQGGFSKVVGVDISPTAIAAARKSLAEMRKNRTLTASSPAVEFYVHDALMLPAPREPISFIWDNTVHQNTFRRGNKADYFTVLRRLARPDTTLLLTIMNGDSQPDGEDYSDGAKNSVMLNIPVQYNDELRKDFGASFTIHFMREGLYDLAVDAPPYESLARLDKFPVQKRGIPSWNLLLGLKQRGQMGIPATTYTFNLRMRVRKLIQQGKVQDGIAAMEREYLQLNPANIKALYDLADVLEGSSQFSLAAKYFERILQVGGPADDVSPRLIHALIHAGDPHGAQSAASIFQRHLDTVLRQDPKPKRGSKPIVFMRHADGLREYELAQVRQREARELNFGSSQESRDEF